MRRPLMFVKLLILLAALTYSSSARAASKVITAEATYSMGDGEMPLFAEAMALQKAKQMALEGAGTYVEGPELKRPDLVNGWMRYPQPPARARKE